MKVISQSVLDPMQCLKVPPQSWLHSCLSLDVGERRMVLMAMKMTMTMITIIIIIITKITLTLNNDDDLFQASSGCRWQGKDG